MARSRRAGTRIAAWTAAAVASVALLAWLVLLLDGGNLDRNDKLASVIGLFVSLAGLGLSAVSLWVARLQLRQSPATPLDDAARLDLAAEALGTAVRVQWEAEVGLRELRRPAPLQLTWSATSRTETVAAPAEAVVGGTITGRVIRLRLHGRLDEIADKFLALPHRQLIVLGEPGAGKTVLAMLLTLALLDRRQRGQPVPVLLALSSWDPTAEHLHTWLIRRLSEDYPALANPTYGPAADAQLVTTGRVLPVLDGLDELPERLRASAIGELDRARAEHPLIVTCRSEEYRQAVTTSGGVLAAAAVVELEPVTATEAVAFLRAAAAPTPERWNQVTSHLHVHPDGPLAAALSTPLMVALARIVYTLPSRDPDELIDLATAGGRAAVERHLLDGFVPAAYTNPPPAPETLAPKLRRPPSPDLARRWLTLLATHLQQRQTRDLAWWRLHRLVAQRTSWRVAGLVFGLAAWFVVGLVAGFAAGVRAGLVTGLATGLALVVFGGGTGPPQRVNRRIRGRLRELTRGLVNEVVFGLVTGLVAGLMTGVAAGVVAGFWGGRATGLLVGLLTGMTFALTLWLVLGFGVLLDWLSSPVDAALAVTPQSVLQSDRTAAMVRLGYGLVLGLAVGLAPRLVFRLVFRLVPELVAGLVPWLAVWLTYWLAAGLAVGLAVVLVATSWGQFTVARAWLAVRRQLPLRLMAFLDDAHRRGLLRQAGAVYQFRHARFQDHLANVSPTSQTDR